MFTAILFFACLFGIQLAYRMKGYYNNQGGNASVMWHDDFSLGVAAFLFVLIVVSAGLYA